MSFSEKFNAQAGSSQTKNYMFAGAVVYTMREGKPLFLILFMQGYNTDRITREIGPLVRVREGEDPSSATYRAVKEKTGLELDKSRMDSNFTDKFSYNYFSALNYGPEKDKMTEISKTRVYSLVQISEEESRNIEMQSNFKFMTLEEINYNVWLRQQQYSLLMRAANYVAVKHNLLREDALPATARV